MLQCRYYVLILNGILTLSKDKNGNEVLSLMVKKRLGCNPSVRACAYALLYFSFLASAWRGASVDRSALNTMDRTNYTASSVYRLHEANPLH